MNNSKVSQFTNPKSLLKMNRAKKTRSVLYSVFRLLILLAIGYIVIYPVFYMLVTSIRTDRSILDPTRIWIPTEVTLDRYQYVFEAIDYPKSLMATLYLEVASALLEVVSCAVIGYGFARFNFRGKKLFTAILFLTIIIPAPMIIMPMVTNFVHLDVFGILGLIGKLIGHDIRPNIIGTVFCFYLPSILGVGLRAGILIYIYIQFFKGLPRELEEAAWIDGATPLRTFISIALPSSGVVIVTVTLFSIIWHWNDYVLSVMYTTGYTQPLAVMLKRLPEILTTDGIYVGVYTPQAMAYFMAACVMFIAPILILYLILQRWFIESIDRVGITG
jgi:hypothetical protein